MPVVLATWRLVGGLLLAVVVAACAPATSDPTGTPPEASSAATIVPDDAPPTALLGVDGGDLVAGALGSYQWGDVGSAAPWLPGSPITVGAGEVAMMTLDPPIPIASWQARASAEPDGSVPNGLSSGGPTVSFGVPGPGTWTIEVAVQFAGSSDSASYYWRMTVQ